MSPHFYDVSIEWNSNRKGTISSSVLPTHIEVATPPQFPNGMEGIWSPEHLFVGAINSCLMTTFLAIAENSKLEFIRFESKGKGKLEMVDGSYMMTEVELIPIVVVKENAFKEKAEKLLYKAEKNCLISNSVKSKIIFNPMVKVNNH